jgi:tripartite-type tricarboxylate transporter receptor subunit TctC
MMIFIATLLVNDGLSQELYPNRPITVVLPWGAGGMHDTVVRTMCTFVEKGLGQPVIVENKTGAGGSLGMNYVLKSKPDGYTLGSPGISAYLIHPHIRKVPYNPFTDSIDITPIYNYNYGLFVRADAPWNSFEDILKYAKNNPGKFTYSCAGVGMPQHICMEQIAMKEGITWTMIPFKSGSEATIASLGGHTEAGVAGPLDAVPHVKAGKLKLLLTIGDKRWRTLPSVPNILEKGYNFHAISYVFYNAPTGVPESIIKKLEDVFNRAKRHPSFIELMEKFEVEVCSMSGKEFSDFWRSKYDEMGKVIKTLGLQEK